MQQEQARVVLLTGDERMAKQLAIYIEYDGMQVIHTSSPDELWAAMTRERPRLVIVDLSSRDVGGDQLLSLSARTRRMEIPFLLLSRQPRRSLTGFAAIVRANDVLCKAEPMTSLAARVRMWAAPAAAA